MREEKRDEFYAEIDRAVRGYFADKLNVADRLVSAEAVEEAVPLDAAVEMKGAAKELFDELAAGRFARIAKSREDMKNVYDRAERVISAFEKVKWK